MKKNIIKNSILIILFCLVNISFATTYNTPVIDGTITESAADWDSDENMGLRPGTGGEDWFFYLTWDADYVYFGFTGFNWPNNSNNHIVGHFDFIKGGTLIGINSEDLGLTADFAFQLTRSGPNGIATFYQYDTNTSNWVETTITWPSTELVYNAANNHTEFRFSWSTLTQGKSTEPSSFVGFAAVENNSDGITQIWPDVATYECGYFVDGPSFTDVSLNALPVGCNPEDQPLPVELSSFTIEAIDQGVLCNWTTESEIENLGFILERKTMGADWIEITSYKNENGLLGQGTTSSYTNYEYLDKFVEPNTTYEYRLADVDYNGVVTYHSVRIVAVENAPLISMIEKFTVLPAYPNPFNPSTTLRYGLDKDSHVTIEIYDVTGQLITTLLKTEQAKGWYTLLWNGTNKHSDKVPAGIYLSRIIAGNNVKTSKLMLLK